MMRIRQLPVTLKLLAIAAAAALIAGSTLEYLQQDELRRAYEAELLESLKRHAFTERYWFDRQVKLFHRIARICANYPPLIKRLQQLHTTGINGETYRRPSWFPGNSLIGTEAHPRVAILYDNGWNKIDAYSFQLDRGQVFDGVPQYVLRNSREQTLITTIAGNLWVLASAPVRAGDSQIGYVLVAAPLDYEFLDNVHRFDTDPNIIALVQSDRDNPKIVVSSDPTQIPEGSLLEDVKKNYLVTGNEFFDYGASDVAVNVMSFRSRKVVDQRLQAVLDVARKQRLTQGIIILIALAISLSWLGARVRRVTSNVQEFAKTHLGAHIAVRHKDFLLQLEEQIKFLEQTVLDVRAKEQQLAHEKLRAAKERLLSYFDAADEMIQTLSRDGRVLYANKKWSDETGYNPTSTGLSIRDFVAEDHLGRFTEAMEHAIAKNETVWLESVFTRRDGKRIDVEGTIRPYNENGDLELHASFRNITERKLQIERDKAHAVQIEHAQRLESLGMLAGGVAHDFNNLLSVILGNAALAVRKIENREEVISRLNMIVGSSERAAYLCKQMLAYSGKGSFVIEPLNLSELIEKMAKLLEVSIDKRVELELDLDKDLPSMEADRAQIQQVVMNLVTNANEAIGGAKGRISISTSTMAVDETFLNSCIENATHGPGDFICLEVRDTGCGMSQQTMKKIFDPFFTTKFTGRGLGLSAMLGIVRAHKGAIHIHSVVGQGTTFKVLFPIRKEGASHPTDNTKAPQPEHVDFRKKKTILVVDDEEHVREMAVAVLEEADCNVLEAEDGSKALDLFAKWRDQIDLVLLDLTMPGLSGEECCREILRINPGAKIIIASGYSEEDVRSRFAKGEISGFVQKPYMPDALIRCVREIIGDE